jgi:hypothetical protein
MDGEWRMFNDKGKLAMFLTIKDGKARRHHASGWCRCQGSRTAAC